MLVIIIYLIYLNGHWQFEAIDESPNTNYYCQHLAHELDEKNGDKPISGNMRIICVEDRREEI